MNHLGGQRSAYLQHAADQPVNWYPWSDEAFALARAQGKPVFLSSGAVWCHWCHVMARESFEDSETARLLNELFISVKLDRDERPDIDRRFQQAVAAMGGGSGWPLSVFLTPDRQVFYGGTYFPPEDRQGRPGFRRVLQAVHELYATRKQEALAYASRITAALMPEPGHPEELSRALLDEAEELILTQYDPDSGGFGSAPKFPMPGALEFLLRRGRDGSGPARDAALRTLASMAAGGFHDHLAGGFHRYSVDEAWIVPHFEKMTDDNAGLLKNYSEGFAVSGEARFAAAARDIIRFAGTVLGDPCGGFFASQDADVTPEDEGGYFTWTDGELREVLDSREYEIVASRLFHPRGAMHHDPRKHVLAANEDAAAISERMGLSRDAFEKLLETAKQKLLARRLTRTAPLIDKALYPSLNGMMIAAYFRAAMVLDDGELIASALTALDRVMQERWKAGRVWHAEEIPGLLEDHIHLVDALIAGYEATGRSDLLDRADELMAVCRERFLDTAEGGFFDTEQEVLGTRIKRIEDVPHPSANAVAIQVLLKLSSLIGKKEYRYEAERSLRLFAGLARQMGIHAGSYFCALHAYYHERSLTVEAAPDSSLARAARLAAARSYAGISYGPDAGRVIACTDCVCLQPVSDVSALPDIFRSS